MATTYWMDAEARLYSSTTGAKSPADIQLNKVSDNGVANITSTPVLAQSVHDKCRDAAIAAHTIWDRK